MFMDPRDLYNKEFIDRALKALSDLGARAPPVIEKPKKGVADLCLVCFPHAREIGKSPNEIAGKLKEMIGESERFSLEVKGGYLNCIFNERSYIPDLALYLWNNRGSLGKGEKKDEIITIEHTSANPNGPFHVGRARNPIIGDTLVRMMSHAGFDVRSQYWVNDMGKQVMILVWGLKNISPFDLEPAQREKEDHDLVRYYQKANAIMEEDDGIAVEINDLLLDYENAIGEHDPERVISKPGKPEIRARDIRDACNSVLEGMRRSLDRLNVSLDEFVYESSVVEDGSLKEVVEGLKKSSLCREEDGARYLDLSELIEGGDQEKFRRRFVFTRSDGSALYTTRDLAYHKWKLDNCDVAVNILGEDHRYQSLMLEHALKEIGSVKVPEAVFYAFVSLPQGKMSTRRGRVVYLDDLLDEAVDLARNEVEKRRDDLDEDELSSISEAVGIGALRFNMIKVQTEKKIVFRWEDALNFEGSTAPFVQYSHARACSILVKSENDLEGEIDWGTLVERSEKDLVKKLSSFDQVVMKSAIERKVHLLTVYLVDVASSFNDFYRDCPVLSEEVPERRKARIALVDLSRETLSTGLDLLGIEAPSTM
jgi:arginyl-tRNA synthetase